MKVKRIVRLKNKFPQCDLTTETENFYIKAGDKYVLVHNSPALFCWSKYPGYPDNSIALKGFTSGPQNAMSSPEQIDAKYGDRPDMAAKLKLGLQLAKYIPEGECWQGDCLFSHDDIKEQEINGTNYLTFMPNKIVYAFSEENADYDKVKNSDFGIAFHTIYKDSDGKMSQGFDVDPTRLNAPDNFYVMSPAINASSSKDDYNVEELEKQFNELKTLEQKLLNNPAYEELVNNSVFMNYWNTFENASLADKKQVNINVNTFINDLKEYIKNKQKAEYDKKLSTLKTDKGRASAEATFNSNVEKLDRIVEDNKSVLTDLVNTLNAAANIKMNMWAGLRKSKNDYSTYYKSRTKGFIPAEGEGIAMSDMDGNIVKIVDRSTFSSYNRDPDIMSGFEHESLQEEIDMSNITLDKKLEKLLGNNKDKFIKTVIKMILDHTYLDYFTNGMYRENEYPADHTDAHGRNINQKLKKVHDFWLDNFGLDTSLRGVGSKIDSAIIHIENSIKETDEYKDSLYWDDSNKLPADEKFKIDLFYEWDGARRNFWGDYDDDDPIRKMSFREFLQDKLDSGDYEDEHEKQLLIDAIEEVKGGSGYFKEMMATQGADMGTFAKKPIKRLTLDEDGANKLAVVAFGRMNPPTIGHEKLIDKMASLANGEKAKLYLSHSVDGKKDPLSYDSKLRWCRKAFGDKVDVVESDAKNVFNVLADLYEDGYTDIVYVGGADRIGGSDDISSTIQKYNGGKTKTGSVLYDFDSIRFEDAGKRNPDSEDPTEQASASLARRFVLEDNFDAFKNYVPFNENDAYRLFKELKYAMKGKEESFLSECILRESRLREANAGEQYEEDACKYLSDKYEQELPEIEFKHMGGNDNEHPDIAVNKNGSNLFYIECKDTYNSVAAQGGEFSLRLNGDTITFLPNAEDSPDDIKCKQAIVDWINNSQYRDKIVNDYSQKGEVNVRLKDTELLNLMSQRIKVHYHSMKAEWICAATSENPYSFAPIDNFENILDLNAVTIRNKSNNSKNISVASYDSFNEFAKSNGFTDLNRIKRGKENVVTFNSSKDLGLRNPKQNIHIMIDDKEYVITINTHPKELPGQYMLRNSNRGNMKILATLSRVRSGHTDEDGLIKYIKSRV